MMRLDAETTKDFNEEDEKLLSIRSKNLSININQMC